MVCKIANADLKMNFASILQLLLLVLWSKEIYSIPRPLARKWSDENGHEPDLVVAPEVKSSENLELGSFRVISLRRRVFKDGEYSINILHIFDHLSTLKSQLYCALSYVMQRQISVRG